MILAGSLIDAMTFWVGGVRNVTAAYGPNALTEDLVAAFGAAQIKRVLIAFARDGDGEAAAGTESERLMAEGFACYRIEFPRCVGANTYTLKVAPAARSLGLLIRKATWLGQGQAPITTSTSVEVEADLPIVVGRSSGSFSCASPIRLRRETGQ